MGHSDQLQLDNHPGFTQAERRLQRIGLGLLTLFAVSGALGAFGDGPLAHGVIHGDGVEIEYERFGRLSAATAVTISVFGSVPDGEPIRFRLERAFLDELDYLDIRPGDALTTYAATDAIFEVPALKGRGHLQLRYKPRRPGVLQTRVTPEAGTGTLLRQFIYY